jgi:hypothetical protein
LFEINLKDFTEVLKVVEEGSVVTLVIGQIVLDFGIYRRSSDLRCSRNVTTNWSVMKQTGLQDGLESYDMIVVISEPSKERVMSQNPVFIRSNDGKFVDIRWD